MRLDSLVKFQEGLGPAEIKRRNRQYAGFIYGSLEGLPLGAATDAVKQIAAETLPSGYSIAFTGQAEEFAKTGGYVIFAFGMALIMIYMVLASQFNSLLQPLIMAAAAGHHRWRGGTVAVQRHAQPPMIGMIRSWVWSPERSCWSI